MAPKIRYSEFADRIDLDAFYEAIGFVPISHDRGNDQGFCLFPENHKNGDTSGKFAIHREKRLWNCFVCEGGDLLSLAMQTQGFTDTDEAARWLYQFTHGDTRSDDDFADYLLEMLADVEKRIETMPYFNAGVLAKFDGPTDYFKSRGISDEIIQKFGLRYADAVTKSAPLTRKADGSLEKIDDDYIGPASVWPHYWKGRLVGWQYRWHDWDKERTRVPKWLPKWTNTTDFPKSTTLYNYDRALKINAPVVVVESLGTVGFVESCGCPAVAWFGSKPTNAQLRLLRRFTQGVILAPDNDTNAEGARIYAKVQEAAEYLQPYVPVFMADRVTPDDVGFGADGLDLNDYAQTDDPVNNLFDHLGRARPVGPSL